ncbi:hypothetical protein OIU79_010966 [Salix purpurea]|uniref:Uncharacterized protein n=1 Tax=Salix purpurea TaxID=77065 RepID=A0A9Q0QHZ4_SALPP|nr:hypothetical protein OIU79_010966 [Salix purpurea]
MGLRKGWNGKGEEADVEGNACRGGCRWGGEDAVARGNGRKRIGGGCEGERLRLQRKRRDKQAHLMRRRNGFAMAEKKVVAARMNAALSNILDALGIFFPIKCEKHKLMSDFLNSFSRSGFSSRILIRCECHTPDGGSGELGGGRACGDCDSAVVFEEEEGRGCDDCDSKSSSREDAGNFDRKCDVIRRTYSAIKL